MDGRFGGGLNDFRSFEDGGRLLQLKCEQYWLEHSAEFNGKSKMELHGNLVELNFTSLDAGR